MPRGKTRDRDGIYTRKDRPGQFWGSWIDASGKRRQRKLDAYTLTQARELLNAEKARSEKARTLGYAPLTEETFSSYAIKFLKYQKFKLRSADEYERQRGIIGKRIFQPVFGQTSLARIDRSDLEKYVVWRSEKVAPATVQKELNVMRRLLERAVEEKLLATNVARKLEMPDVPQGRTRYLSPPELKAALAAAPQWMRPPMALAALTGMRRGELLGLRWRDLDLEHKRVYLRETKNGTLRVLTLGSMAVEIFGTLPVGVPGDLVFSNVDKAQLSVYIRRVFKSIGIADASFHTLRHTTASLLVMEGVDLYAVGQILGHKTPRMTQRYAHLSPDYMAAAVGKLDRALALPSAENKKRKVHRLSLPLRDQGSAAKR